MRLDDSRRSDNIEDRRGMRVGKPVLTSGIGLIVILLYVVFGGDPTALMQNGSISADPSATSQGPVTSSPEEEAMKDFVAAVLGETEDVWTELLRNTNTPYRAPNLVLFSEAVQSACGTAGSATGPFYCPGDEKVYLDMSFFQELSARFGAPGDFARAYVIAHEVGHHVQNLLGLTNRVHAARGRVSDTEYNQLSVRLELQADFLAGVWAHHANRKRRILEEGDVEEGLGAANAIGDDRLQKQAQGYVVPDAFTHGTSAQRMRWFRLGLETGDLSKGDTFNADGL